MRTHFLTAGTLILSSAPLLFAADPYVPPAPSGGNSSSYNTPVPPLPVPPVPGVQSNSVQPIPEPASGNSTIQSPSVPAPQAMPPVIAPTAPLNGSNSFPSTSGPVFQQNGSPVFSTPNPFELQPQFSSGFGNPYSPAQQYYPGTQSPSSLPGSYTLPQEYIYPQQTPSFSGQYAPDMGVSGGMNMGMSMFAPQYNSFSTSYQNEQRFISGPGGSEHARYPYYSYRRPWYSAGPVSRNVNIIW